MFYVDHFDTRNKLVAIADTSSLAIDYISDSEYKKYKQSGVEIYEWQDMRNKITASMNNRCNNKLYRHLERLQYHENILEYLKNNVVYTLSKVFYDFNTAIDFNSSFSRFFPYNENFGFIVFCVKLIDNSILVCKVTVNNLCFVERIQYGEFNFRKYPSVSGNFILSLARRKNILLQNINSDDVYLVLYSSSGDKLLLVNEICIGTNNGGSSYFIYDIPKGLVLE